MHIVLLTVSRTRKKKNLTNKLRQHFSKLSHINDLDLNFRLRSAYADYADALIPPMKKYGICRQQTRCAQFKKFSSERVKNFVGKG